jgi:hypothetical protein
MSRNSKSQKNFMDYDTQMQELHIKKMLDLEKSLSSNDPQTIMKATAYVKGMQKSNTPVAMQFDPFETNSGYGWKRDRKQIGFNTLKAVAATPIAQTVFKTRIFQVQNFLKFTTDDQKEGYTIRRKLSRFETKRDIKKEDQKTIEYIADFLENSRRPTPKNGKSAINFDAAKWDEFEDLDDFVRLILTDSLTYDQSVFILNRNRRFELLSYKPVDASTIRLLDTIDPRYRDAKDIQYDEIMGMLPKYGQIYSGNIYKDPKTNEQLVWYPWEMCFATRNKNTNIFKNQYGTSELETLTNIITWLLYGMQYNGNIFKNGSNPKGMLKFKDQDADVIAGFKQMWRNTIQGPGNEHKIAATDADVDWIDMSQSNKDMEFNSWIEFLITMYCSVFTIDPSELGFHFKGQSNAFGQSGEKQRLDHSKEKGLKPILMFLQKILSKYIVEEINPDFEFVFTGVDLDDEEAKLKLDKLKTEVGGVSMEEMFEKYSGRKLTDKDTILNQIALQYKQAEQFGGEGENAMVDQENGGEGEGAANPFEEFAKAAETDPIMAAALNKIDEGFSKQ